MDKNKKILFSLFLITTVTSTSIGIVVFVNVLQADRTLDSKIQGLMSQGKIPSFTAGIIINDTLEWVKGYGDQPDLDTVYMIGSVSKMFAATAIMQLYDDGLLDLDTDINNYIPFSVRHPSYPSTPITVRMLLTHRSGINNDVSNNLLWDFDAEMINWSNHNLGTAYPLWDPRPTLLEFLNGSLNSTGPFYAPDNWISQPGGTERHYSNTGFLLLGYIVEQLTNQSYSDYMQENVFDPLTMTNTGLNYTDFIGKNAIPYELRENQNYAYPIHNQYNFGGGGMRCSITDLAHFLIAHMNQGSYNNAQILQPQTVDLMQTANFCMSGINPFGGLTYVGQGLAWTLYETNITAHGGATPGFLAKIAFKTTSNGKYGIVFAVNRGASLVVDDYLVNTFYPTMIEILLDEAARLFYS